MISSHALHLARCVRAAAVAALTMLYAGTVRLASAQPSTGVAQPGVSEAQQALAARDFSRAVQILRDVTTREPTNGRAWNMLGVALRRDGRWTDAVAAHRRAIAVETVRPMAYYQLGLTFVAGKQLDSAFAWLMEAKRTGRVNMVGLIQDPLGATLVSDHRFAQLMPSAKELADPFKEPATIIHEMRGEAAGDQFGWIARNIGDVDGDRVSDIVTSAPTNQQGGAGAGKVYVYSGKSGKLLWSVIGESGATLGLGVEAAGDVDADGVPDVAAGAPGIDKVLIYSGRTGKTIRTFNGESRGINFGRRVAAAGDVNKDGFADVAVSAPGYGVEKARSGRVYVLSGKDGSILFTFDGEDAGHTMGTALAAKIVKGTSWLVVGAAGAGEGNRGRVYVFRNLKKPPAFTIDPDATSVSLGGMFVSVIGDVDHDGVPDIYGSDWSNAAAGAFTGRIFVHSGADGRRLLTLTGESAGDGFGIGPADAGDVDGDGHDDLVVGAWQHSGLAAAGGKVYLYSGKSGQLIRAWTGKVQGENFGFDATGLGDVDGDGTIDLLLTSAGSAINGALSGRMFVIRSVQKR